MSLRQPLQEKNQCWPPVSLEPDVRLLSGAQAAEHEMFPSELVDMDLAGSGVIEGRRQVMVGASW